MIAIELTNIKDFMNKLLCTETFDHFLLQEAIIKKDASYVIDARLSEHFYDSNEINELGLEGMRFLPYSMLRGNCFNIIKGKHAPSEFKFIFLLSPKNLERTLASLDSSYTSNDISGMFFNIKYQNQLLTLTTGISYNVFSTDKSLDGQWDRLLCKFLENNAISFEEL